MRTIIFIQANTSDRRFCRTLLSSLCLWVTIFALHLLNHRMPLAQSVEEQQSVQGSIAHLSRIMDRYHDRFWVYDDVSSGGNHFHSWGKFSGIGGDAMMVGDETQVVSSGATSIRCGFSYSGTSGFAGFNMMNGHLPAGQVAPQFNFGNVPDAGILALSGAVELVFRARGEKGGETIDFFVAGVGRNTGMPFPDSSPAIHIADTPIALTDTWQEYRIPLLGNDLSYVLGGFGWGASGLNDADQDGSVIFYVDEIYFVLDEQETIARLDEPRFLQSFDTLPFQVLPLPVDDFDFILRNTAFTYDNAVALIAFLAEGSGENLRRAKLIGDAFVYALQNDRFYDSGPIRDAYSAGDIALPPGWLPNNRPATVPVSGFFQTSSGEFFEIFQTSVSTGNNAWAMISLLALFKVTANQEYLDAARTVGEFIRTMRNDSGTYRGFLGGLDNPETLPQTRPFASVEHNLDIYAAFTVMHEITGEAQWTEDAQHALTFILSMRDPSTGCFWTGTIDPEEINTLPGQLPLDTQSWAALALVDALPDPQQTLQCAQLNHGHTSDGFMGFDFNEDKDGVWFEGTAQMATAFAHANLSSEADIYKEELRRAQNTSPFGDNQGIVAASHDGITSGFGFLLFRRLHIAATAWNAFAQLQFNPFYQTLPTVEETDIVSLKINGEDPASGVVVSAGQVALTLDMFPGDLIESLDWYFGLIFTNFAVPDEVPLNTPFFFVPGGLTTVPAPIVTNPPIVIVDGQLLNLNLPPGTTILFFFILLDGGGNVVAFDLITVEIPL